MTTYGTRGAVVIAFPLAGFQRKATTEQWPLPHTMYQYTCRTFLTSGALIGVFVSKVVGGLAGATLVP